MYGLLLKGVESLKVIVVSHELVKGALLNEATVLHHQDLVKFCKLHFFQAVSDYDASGICEVCN